MIKEPEDEAFDALEKAQQRKLLVDKGCAERGCMGYDSRDGDAPVEMSIHRPWRGLTLEIKMDMAESYFTDEWAINRAIQLLSGCEAALRSKNT